MSFQIVYKPLVDIRIHHDYFLDDGETKFESMSNEDQKVQLADYKVGDYLQILPTPKTRLHFDNYKVVFNTTDQGFNLYICVDEYSEFGSSDAVYCPKIAPSNDLTFTFEVRVSDSLFQNYTKEVDDENRFCYFSNVIPSGEPGSFPNFLDQNEVYTEFLLSPENSRKIIHEIITKEIALNNDLGYKQIISIDEADITDPENVDLLNTYIETEKRNGLIGFIRLSIKGDSNNDLLTDVTVTIPNEPNQVLGCLPDEVPNPIIRFENRSTFWRYIKLQTDETFTTKQEQPLTQNGFISLEGSDLDPNPSPGPGNSGGNPGNSNSNEEIFFPNPEVFSIRIIDNKVYSEIFI